MYRFGPLLFVCLLVGCTTTRVITITTKPPDATIKVDNVERGKGSLTEKFVFSGKEPTHTVSVSRLGYREQSVSVAKNYDQETLVVELVAARHGIPVVMTTYAEAVVWPDEGEQISDRALYRAMPEWDPLFARTFGRAFKVIAPSWHCAQGPLRFIPRERVEVAYAGIDTEAVAGYRAGGDRYRRELGMLDDRVILYVGQITPRKGPQYLARALPAILEREPRARAVFIGSDLGFRPELERMVEPFKERVTITGGVDTATLLKYYAAGDVLAFPTATERECMGMSMKEAMAAGTSVVVFLSGGAPGAVETGVTGYVVDVGDVAALSDRLVAVLQDGAGTTREACVARARALFDVRFTAAQEERVLAEALEWARSGRR